MKRILLVVSLCALISQLHVFRPGLLYQSQQVGFDADPGAGLTFDTESQTTMTVLAELEAEIFLRDNFSVSASHGIAFRSYDPGFGADSETSFGTFGNNFTSRFPRLLLRR